MAGIYIHIPFCKTKCNYCDFYSVTNSKLKNQFIQTLVKEIELYKNYFGNNTIETIYFGGGTPSLLNQNDINTILYTIKKHFTINNQPEITLEVNPDDINDNYLNELKKTPINRFSIGIQSFNNKHLTFLKRRHNGQKAIESVKLIQNVGYKNISIDLIYGIPNLNLIEWENNLKQAINLNIQHISAYHLTFEKGTTLTQKLEKNEINELSEKQSLDQFKIMLKLLRDAGFENYEISNFAKTNYYSKHNSNYWLNKPYLGIGPSAHSYNLETRHWNVSNIHKYIKAINSGQSTFTIEKLSLNDKYNDYILTRLRTCWGVNTDEIKTIFGVTYKSSFEKIFQTQINNKYIIKNKNTYKLSNKGKLISNNIIEKFIIID